jgi:urease accessory protein
MGNVIAKVLIAVFLLGASSAAFAHPGHNVSGIGAGLLHPVSGLDHLLAMLAVGLWAAQGNSKKRGGRKIWLLPATFITMLAVGAVIAMQWQTLPLIESGIAASVLALIVSVALTALFGLLHGYAHGLELTKSTAPAAYALGFLVATAGVHLSGIAMGVATRKRYAMLSKLLGGAIAVSGAYLFAFA